MYMQNYYVGGNQMVIVYRNGTCHVLEEYENYDSVFTGTFAQCFEYCNKRNIEYEESKFF